MADIFDQAAKEREAQGIKPSAAPSSAAPPSSSGDVFDEAAKERTVSGDSSQQGPQPTLFERTVGPLIPQAAVGPLSWIQRNVNEPLNRMAEKGAEVGREKVKSAVGEMLFNPNVDPDVARLSGQPQVPVSEVEKQHPVAMGIAGGVGGVVGGTLADPRNWPLLASGAARPLLQNMISGGFAAMQGKGAVDAAQNLYDNWDNLTPEQRSELFTQGGLSAAFAAASGTHAGADVAKAGYETVKPVVEGAHDKLIAPAVRGTGRLIEGITPKNIARAGGAGIGSIKLPIVGTLGGGYLAGEAAERVLTPEVANKPLIPGTSRLKAYGVEPPAQEPEFSPEDRATARKSLIEAVKTPPPVEAEEPEFSAADRAEARTQLKEATKTPPDTRPNPIGLIKPTGAEAEPQSAGLGRINVSITPDQAKTSAANLGITPVAPKPGLGRIDVTPEPGLVGQDYVPPQEQPAATAPETPAAPKPESNPAAEMFAKMNRQLAYRLGDTNASRFDPTNERHVSLLSATNEELAAQANQVKLDGRTDWTKEDLKRGVGKHGRYLSEAKENVIGKLMDVYANPERAQGLVGSDYQNAVDEAVAKNIKQSGGSQGADKPSGVISSEGTAGGIHDINVSGRVESNRPLIATGENQLIPQQNRAAQEFINKQLGPGAVSDVVPEEGTATTKPGFGKVDINRTGTPKATEAGPKLIDESANAPFIRRKAISRRGEEQGAPDVKRAINEIEERFPVNPKNPGANTVPKELASMRGGEPEATFTMSERDGRLGLKGIQSINPGTGEGSRLLKQLTDIADKHGVTMELTASPYGDEATRLDSEQLKSWYSRHGFVPEEGHDPSLGYMVREPKVEAARGASKYYPEVEVEGAPSKLVQRLMKTLDLNPRVQQMLSSLGLNEQELLSLMMKSSPESLEAMAENHGKLKPSMAFARMSKPDLLKAGWTQQQIDNGEHLPKVSGGVNRDDLQLKKNVQEKVESRSSRPKPITEPLIQPNQYADPRILEPLKAQLEEKLKASDLSAEDRKSLEDRLEEIKRRLKAGPVQPVTRYQFDQAVRAMSKPELEEKLADLDKKLANPAFSKDSSLKPQRDLVQEQLDAVNAAVKEGALEKGATVSGQSSREQRAQLVKPITEMLESTMPELSAAQIDRAANKFADSYEADRLAHLKTMDMDVRGSRGVQPPTVSKRLVIPDEELAKQVAQTIDLPNFDRTWDAFVSDMKEAKLDWSKVADLKDTVRGNIAEIERLQNEISAETEVVKAGSKEKTKISSTTHGGPAAQVRTSPGDLRLKALKEQLENAQARLATGKRLAKQEEQAPTRAAQAAKQSAKDLQMEAQQAYEAELSAARRDLAAAREAFTNSGSKNDRLKVYLTEDKLKAVRNQKR